MIICVCESDNYFFCLRLDGKLDTVNCKFRRGEAGEVCPSLRHRLAHAEHCVGGRGFSGFRFRVSWVSGFRVWGFWLCGFWWVSGCLGLGFGVFESRGTSKKAVAPQRQQNKTPAGESTKKSRPTATARNRAPQRQQKSNDNIKTLSPPTPCHNTQTPDTPHPPRLPREKSRRAALNFSSFKVFIIGLQFRV